MQKSIGKWEIQTPCKIVAPKNVNLKLCTRDYVGETIPPCKFGSNRYSGGFSPYRRNITALIVTFLTVLSLSFFSGTRPRQTAEPIFTLYGSNAVFPHGSAFWGLGVRTMGDVIWGNMPLFPAQKMALNRQFQVKTPKYNNRNISATIRRSS